MLYSINPEAKQDLKRAEKVIFLIPTRSQCNVVEKGDNNLTFHNSVHIPSFLGYGAQVSLRRQINRMEDPTAPLLCFIHLYSFKLYVTDLHKWV
jgi:hypothetical protein